MFFFELISHLFLLLGHIAQRNMFPKPLHPQKEEELLRSLSQGDGEARRLLIEHNLRLVAHVVRKFQNTRLESDELISIGIIGLIKAVDSYTLGRQTKLATYAARCIENEVLMYLRSTKKLENEVSLEEPVGIDQEGNVLTNMDILGTPADAVIDEVSRKIQLERIRQGVEKCLEPREKEIFCLRYGLTNGRCVPQREIAQRLQISRSYVSRLEKRAVEKIKDYLLVDDAAPPVV